jgi:hypothetical protein
MRLCQNAEYFFPIKVCAENLFVLPAAPSIIRLGIIIPFQIQILKHSAWIVAENLQKSIIFHLFLLGLYWNTLCALNMTVLFSSFDTLQAREASLLV